jgi:hypothetical protein
MQPCKCQTSWEAAASACEQQEQAYKNQAAAQLTCRGTCHKSCQTGNISSMAGTNRSLLHCAADGRTCIPAQSMEWSDLATPYHMACAA